MTGSDNPISVEARRCEPREHKIRAVRAALLYLSEEAAEVGAAELAAMIELAAAAADSEIAPTPADPSGRYDA